MPGYYKYGSYTYPKSTIFAHPDEPDIALRNAKTPGRHGGYGQGGLLDVKKIVLTGHLIAEPGDVLRYLWDAFKAAHQPGRFLELFIEEDDRSIIAEIAAIKDVDAAKYVHSIPWEVAFSCPSPFFEEYPTPAAQTLTSSGGSVTLAGTAPSPPLIFLTFASGTLGAGRTCTVTNSTTGKSLTLTPGTNVTPIVEAARGAVTDGSGGDITEIFTDGTFFELVPGSNTIAIATTGGLAVASASIGRRGRWW